MCFARFVNLVRVSRASWSPPPALSPLPFPAARALRPSLLGLRRALAAARAALAFTDAFEDLGETEIDLALLHVDADHLDLDLVTEAIALVGVLADQRMAALDEPVVVVGHCRDVDHAFDEMLDQLDEQAERRDAGEVALEFIADLVGHELHLLPLQQLALRIVGAALHFRSVAGHLGQLVDPLFARLVGQQGMAGGAQRAVHHQIRIAADRRGEVRIAG